MKTCPGYADQVPHVLVLSEFGKNVARADGQAVYCKKCAAASQKAWRQAHPDKVRAAKKKYRELEKQQLASSYTR